ncbi:MAG: arylsulfatase [Pseudomonadota bacterium]
MPGSSNAQTQRRARTRRLTAALALGGALCGTPSSGLCADTTQGARPNVVVILADDLGWNDVGYHGSDIRTPNLDALAANGVVLDQFHSQPTCTPTRAALMTGKSPQRLGIYRQFAKNADRGLPASEQTLADHFRAAGYQTWMVGKWHLGHAAQHLLPNARGFEHFYGHVTGGIGYWDHVHGGGLDWQRNGVTVREVGYSTRLLTQEAVDLIERRDPDRPFLLYASYNAPHLPNEAPAATVAAYADSHTGHRRLHAAMVTELDAAVGEVVAALTRVGERDNTLIWFMSDNGGLNPNAGMGGYVDLARRLERWFEPPVPIRMLEFIRVNALEGGSDNGPLRFGKGSVYEGGVRVPAVLSWPGTLEPAQVATMITAQDVLPTLLAATAQAVPADLNGGNHWPTIARQDAQPVPDYVTIGQRGEQAFYRWPWKLIARDAQMQLYNLVDDPFESADLAAQEPARIARLRAALDASERAPSLHIPLYRVFWDPDFFGGEEDRRPWADVVSPERT